MIQAWTAQVISQVLQKLASRSSRSVGPASGTTGDSWSWGNDLEALDLLLRDRLVPPEYARSLVGAKRQFLQEQLSRIESIAVQLSHEAKTYDRRATGRAFPWRLHQGS